MKVSHTWLSEWLGDPLADAATLAGQLDMLGLVVDRIQHMFCPAGVLVAQITAVSAHPTRPDLSLCQVRADRLYQVVCDTSAVQVGLCVPLARVGECLPSGQTIASGEWDGIASEGVLCSEHQLGLGEDDSGPMALPMDAVCGQPLSEHLGLPDWVYDVQLTPNRGDCASMRGIARDLAAKNELVFSDLQQAAIASTIDDIMPIQIVPGAGCKRYVGRIIKGIDPDALTPNWMCERLRRAGQRPISPVVDITNYVMLELGQPMHGFDLNLLGSSIEVRAAQADETLELLDGRKVTLTPNTLVISSAGTAVAMAGIMGGSQSAVHAGTRDILLEAAWFEPQQIAGRQQHYQTQTESGYRFERQVDSQLQQTAMERATQLVLEIVGGAPGPCHVVTDGAEQSQVVIELRVERVSQVLGFVIADDVIVYMLSRLGFTLQTCAGGWSVSVPSYRPDVRIEVDLIEEIVRMYGYDRVPRTHAQMIPMMRETSATALDNHTIKTKLVQRGYSEIVTYSFVDRTLQAQLFADTKQLVLENPVSEELSVMRVSLWPGLLSSLQHNLNHSMKLIRIFEIGPRFIFDSPQAAHVSEQVMLAGLISGHAQVDHWNHTAREVDFFDAKGDLEALFALADCKGVRFESDAHPLLHPAQSARLVYRGDSVGWLGRLAPHVQRALDLPQSAILYELERSLLAGRPVPSFVPYSKYPAIYRDMAILMDKSMGVETVRDCIVKHAPDCLQASGVVDIYSGAPIDERQKSVTFRLRFQRADRTLLDSEINDAMAGIIGALEQRIGVSLRV